MSWGKTYQDWEALPCAATAELVRDALTYERQGWPMPISGDLTRTGSPCPDCGEAQA